MIEILRTDDPIRLHFCQTLLEEAEIAVLVVGGGVYAQMPSRLLVPDGEAELALRLIVEAERSL
jgi:hypothetical protein